MGVGEKLIVREGQVVADAVRGQRHAIRHSVADLKAGLSEGLTLEQVGDGCNCIGLIVECRVELDFHHDSAPQTVRNSIAVSLLRARTLKVCTAFALS